MNNYKKAMQNIHPDPDFERNTLNRLAQKPRRRSLRRWIAAGTAVAVCAAAAIVLPGQLLNRQKDMEMPLATGMPVAGAPDVYAAFGGEMYEESGAVMYDEASYMVNEAFDTEEYSAIEETGFRSALSSPLSTFAADVDTAGYTILRRKLLEGGMPDADSVRIEEMLNYFSYEGLSPKDGSPVAVHTAMRACPWNEKAAVLFVGVGAQAIEAEELPPSNLVFLVDVSGSMDSSDKLGLIKQAFHLLCGELRPEDTVSIVTYAGFDSVALEGVSGSEKGAILDAVDSMTAWGSTNGGEGILTAYELAQKHYVEGGNNRVILMTDGDLNVGLTSEAELTDLITEKRETGVFLSVFGFGTGNIKDNRMEALADNGNGSYQYIDSLIEAKRSLITQIGASFFTVAKDVKLQVEFNPEYVDSYRLIGYENRQMAAEDFADDTKDGGEMGSGHTVVALYEIVPRTGASIAGVEGTGEGGKDVSLKYQTSETTGSNEIATVAVRYKAPDGEESRLMEQPVPAEDAAQEDMRRNVDLACAIAEFGMTLRDSEFKGTSDYDAAIDLMKTLQDQNGDEIELMYLAERAKSIK